MKRSPFLFALVLLVAACSGNGPGNAARTYLAIGDSYTIGEGVTLRETFPVQLSVLLRARGESVSDPTIIAGTGWTTSEIRQRVAHAPLDSPYDLVTVLAGVNDQFRGGDPERYRDDMARLLDDAVELAGGDPSRVVVVSIPDWSVSPAGRGMNRSGTGAGIDAFNAVNRELAEEAGAQWADVTAFSRSATEPVMFARDGLHPSAMQYAEWARAVLPEARRALASSPVNR